MNKKNTLLREQHFRTLGHAVLNMIPLLHLTLLGEEQYGLTSHPSSEVDPQRLLVQCIFNRPFICRIQSYGTKKHLAGWQTTQRGAPNVLTIAT